MRTKCLLTIGLNSRAWLFSPVCGQTPSWAQEQILSLKKYLRGLLKHNHNWPASRFAVAIAEARHRHALAGFWPHTPCARADRDVLIQVIIKFHAITADQQAFALDQSTGFGVLPGSVMNGTLDSISSYDHLRKTTGDV